MLAMLAMVDDPPPLTEIILGLKSSKVTASRLY